MAGTHAHRWRGPGIGMVLGVLAVMLAMPGAVARADNDNGEAVDPAQLLERVIAQLTAEAEGLDQFGEEHESPQRSRPHPLIVGHERALATLALERMQDDFTGNAYRDTYIRWHLLWTAREVMRDQLQRYLEVGEHELPAGTTRQVLGLLRGMPEPIQRARRSEHRYEPVEARREYLRLRRETAVRVGYPPFAHTYYGREAMEYVSGERRAEIERLTERMEQARARYRVIRDEEAINLNDRIDWMNRTLRQYRGELIYTLMQTGDDDLFQRAIREIGDQVQRQQWAAIDLMRYMYLAAMDGYLLLFDETHYQRAARELRRIAEASDEYRPYLFGDEEPPNYYRPDVRNFGEYAFHMVHLLEDPGAIRWFQQQVTAPEPPSAARRRTDVEFTPYTFTMNDVRAARNHAVRTLLNPDADRRLRPTYDLQQSRMEQLRGRGQSVRRQELVHEFGNHALVNWALLESGENYQDPRLFRRINWVLTSDVPYTFDRGMRLQMLAQMPAERWRPWIRRDLRWLTNAMTEHGNWGSEYTGGEATGWGDHANGAYGVLGLWAAQQMGVEIPLAVWQRVDEHWRQTQHESSGGWAMGMFNVDTGDDEDNPRDAFSRRVTGPMTATGVSTLTLTERYLYAGQRTDPDQQNVSTHLLRGIDWLDNHFALRSDDPTMDWFYYMWTVQRVGETTGYRAFNGVDWFRDVTAEILNRQRPNGLWEDEAGRQGPLVSTSFALLYLANSYDPIGISKVRFDGRWNNRPNDLLNFVQWASDQYQTPTGWQIVSLDQPVFQLIESPLLYIATNDSFELSDDQLQRLREYIEAGGMLVLNPDRMRSEVARSYTRLTEQLYPDLELRDVPTDHMIYRVHQRLQPNVRMRMIDNGVRPLVVQFVRDIGEDLQANRVGRSDSFDVLSNLYLYAVSLNPRRSRLETSYVVPADEGNVSTDRRIRVARLAHGGTHDPEPGAMTQLEAMMAREHGVAVQHETIDPAALSDQPLALMTALGDAELSESQLEAIRGWLERGGTLWLDAVGGSREAVENARELLRRIAPDTPARPLSSRSPIITGQGIDGGYDNRSIQFRYYALREMGPVTSPRLQAIEINDRPAIIFSPEDLTTGLAGLEHWNIFGYSVPSARRFLANAILETFGN